MEHEEFMALCGAQLEVGQCMLASSMRQVMALRAPELYEHIADADDALFLEPLLFAHVSKKAPVESLPQLILGALPPDLVRMPSMRSRT